MAVGVCALAASAGCGSSTTSEENPPAAAEIAPPPKSAAAAPPAFRPVNPSRVAVDPDVAERESEAEPAAADEAPPRDLGAELEQAFGDPAQCFPPEVARAHPDGLSVSVWVMLSEDGRVSVGSVTARGLPREARACLKRHVEALTFQTPISNAPRRVTASVRVQLDPPPPPAQEWEVPSWATPPAVVLPASVGDGPAPGSVPPGRTLPAKGGGRPPGFVKPRITLPPLGPSGQSRPITGDPTAE